MTARTLEWAWRGLVMAAVALAILLSAACGGAETEPSPAAEATPLTLTIDEVYEGVQRSLDQPGMIYRAVTTRQNAPVGSTLWVDAQHNVARQEFGTASEGSTTITTAQGAYIVTPYDPRAAIAQTDPIECPEASLAVAITLTCPDGPFETYTLPDLQQTMATPEVTVDFDEIDGRPTILLVARREQQPWRSGPVVETRRLYLDPDSFLPVVEDVERESGDQTSHERLTYEHTFVPADTLPADFFDPLSLRALRPDPEQGLSGPPVGFTLYWLGTRTGAMDRFPEVELWASDRYDITVDPSQNDQVTLYYTRVSDPFGTTWLFTLTEYSRDVWESIPPGTHDPAGPCWTQEDVVLQDGAATIFHGFSWPDNVPPAPEEGCPTDRPNDQFLAHVFLGETVVVVAPWDWPEQSMEGIEEVIRALQPRSPKR